ncbi:uncharacterized protein CDAR_249041 [Caerostris darwini]|uniref:Gustatory receptor n=1 Tax=Caerostris darwini TaxID=1538125 RepID=A0AAV4PRZ4_9ARAC|nr:uncharacterized protein CDAR_249041 [Caerostris darwini]
MQNLIFYSLPSMAFGFFYTIVCNHIRHIIKQIAATHSERREPSFEKFLEDYSNIKSIVEQIDKDIGLLVFLSIISTSLLMCFSTYVILNPEVHEGSFLRFQLYCGFLGSFILFIIITASASMVEEASLEVGSQAHTLSKSRGKSVFVQQIFSMFFQKGITLTVWRIVPIRRSLGFGITGIIFTYTFMFYGLMPMRSHIESNQN